MPLIRYIEGMSKGNRRATVGPATRYVSGELRAQRARLEWTIDDVVEKTGIPRATAQRAFGGESAIPTEVLVALSIGMGMDIGQLMKDAAEATE